MELLDLAHPTTQPGTLNRLEYVETTCRRPLEYGLRYAFSTSKPTHTPRQADTIVGVHELHLVIRRELPAHEQVLARLEAEVRLVLRPLVAVNLRGARGTCFFSFFFVRSVCITGLTPG